MPGLIWDIQAEHLDEAEFLLEQWLRLNDSPRITLARLSGGFERRLLARIDGLVVGGEAVVKTLLLPALAEGGDALRVAAAVWAILQGPSLDACAQVLARLDEAPELTRRGLVLGLSHARREGLIAWIAQGIEARSGAGLAARLELLVAHRVDAGARLTPWLCSEELEIRRAGARLARYTSDSRPLQYLGASAQVADHELRWAAIESGLIRQLEGAWELACAEAFTQLESGPLPHRRAALAWVGALGDAATHARLLDALSAAPTPALLWAASLCGRRRAIEVGLELLEHPQLARHAGELVRVIAGLPCEDRDKELWLDRGLQLGASADAALPRLERDALDASLVPARDDQLRLPNPEAIRAWWQRHGSSFSPKPRYLVGRPLDAATFIHALDQLPTRRRHPLALELAARTHGKFQLATRSLAAVQGGQLVGLREALTTVDLQRGRPLPN